MFCDLGFEGLSVGVDFGDFHHVPSAEFFKFGVDVGSVFHEGWVVLIIVGVGEDDHVTVVFFVAYCEPVNNVGAGGCHDGFLLVFEVGVCLSLLGMMTVLVVRLALFAGVVKVAGAGEQGGGRRRRRGRREVGTHFGRGYGSGRF